MAMVASARERNRRRDSFKVNRKARLNNLYIKRHKINSWLNPKESKLGQVEVTENSRRSAMKQVYPDDFRPFAKMATRHYSSPVTNAVVLVFGSVKAANDYADGNKEAKVYCLIDINSKKELPKTKKNVEIISSFEGFDREVVDILHIEGLTPIPVSVVEKFSANGALVIANACSFKPEHFEYYAAFTSMLPANVYRFGLLCGDGYGVVTASREFTDRVVEEKFKAVPSPTISHQWALRLYGEYLSRKEEMDKLEKEVDRLWGEAGAEKEG